MLPKFTLVLGGAASGKSAFAEQLVEKTRKPRVYLATSQVLDGEMQSRVDRHLSRRGAGWRTIQAPLTPETELNRLTADQVCLLDCATMWLSNHLLAGSDTAAAGSILIGAIERSLADVVVVSNEVGGGIVPDNALARQFRDAQGRLNAALAERADLVVLVVAGLPMVLKGDLP